MSKMESQKLIVLSLLSCLVCVCVGDEATLPSSDHHLKQPISFLKRFGYLKEGNEHNAESLVDAIKSMQAFAGLKQTGEVDNATLALMKSPRCSHQDMDASEGKAKRYTVMSKWAKFVLDYKVFSYPTITNGLTTADVDQIIATAWDTWAKAAPKLSFPLSTAATPTMKVNFYKGTHGDKYPFDGAGGALGHGFYPSNGNIHFDDDETWTQSGRLGTDMAWVTTHEFGHAIGLGHSTLTAAVMYPYYMGYKGTIVLDADDIAGILSLYP